jgi:methylglutaconyl-CoA hydratase
MDRTRAASVLSCYDAIVSDVVQLERRDAIVTLTLNDPAKRNALGAAMFDALDARLRETASDVSAHVLHFRANGKAFCAGFDLSAAVVEPALLESFILRLSGAIRVLRRLPMVVIAEVQGAALAGGCALVSACDLVIASPSAKFGYPVHALGISPAVTIPTLSQMIGPGPARSLLLGGQIVTTAHAESIGLVTRVSASDDSLATEAAELCATIAGHGRAALRATKHWINELDGSLDEQRFHAPAQSSAVAATQPAAIARLREAWRQRTR